MKASETTPDQADDALQRVAHVLLELAANRAGSLSDLFALVHGELRQIAHSQRISVDAGMTMSTTALVNEAYLKLHDARLPTFADRRHFFAIAARAMRQVLTDAARARLATKRGSGIKPETLDADADFADERAEATQILEIGAALDLLEAQNERLAQVVYLRFYAGLTDPEISTILDVAQSTVRRDWSKARGWLYQQLALGVAEKK